MFTEIRAMSNRRHTLHLKQPVNSQKWAWLGGFNSWLSGSVEGLGYSQGPTSMQLPTYHKHKSSAWLCMAAKEAYVFKQACCLIISYIITCTVYICPEPQLCWEVWSRISPHLSEFERSVVHLNTFTNRVFILLKTLRAEEHCIL